jgi:hypothetical protein
MENTKVTKEEVNNLGKICGAEFEIKDKPKTTECIERHAYMFDSLCILTVQSSKIGKSCTNSPRRD